MRIAATLRALGPRRALLLVAAVAWAGFWAWAFGFAYSENFFAWNRHARWTGYVAVWSASLLLPGSALRQWGVFRRGARSAAKAFGRHLVASLAVLAAVAAVLYALARAPAPWHLEADDAMGFGIDFVGLLAIAIAATLVLGVGLGVSRARAARRG